MHKTPDCTQNLSFSQRNGYESIPQQIQPEDLPFLLRNELCAAIKDAYSASTNGPGPHLDEECYRQLKVANWCKALRYYSMRKLGYSYNLHFNSEEFLDSYCLPIIIGGSFNKTLETIEDLVNLVGGQQPSFPEEIHNIFQSYQIPYILKKIEPEKWWIIQTGSLEEQQSILSTFSCLQDLASKYVQEHLERAGHELTKGDYIRSTQESLKALEACLRFVCDEPNKAGGEALKACKKIYLLPDPICETIDKLWHYRNDAPDIGHAMKDAKYPPPDRWDAQLIYVTCCGFIKYLINKKNSTTKTD